MSRCGFQGVLKCLHCGGEPADTADPFKGIFAIPHFQCTQITEFELLNRDPMLDSGLVPPYSTHAPGKTFASCLTPTLSSSSSLRNISPAEPRRWQLNTEFWKMTKSQLARHWRNRRREMKGKEFQGWRRMWNNSSHKLPVFPYMQLKGFSPE